MTICVFVAFPPVFKEKLRDKAYMVGSSITVRCQVLGNPPASVSWYRNDEHLYEGGRLQLAQEGDGFFSMTILHTKPNDFAVYKCIARNKLGRVTTRARLLPGGKGITGTIVFLFLIRCKHETNKRTTNGNKQKSETRSHFHCYS